jgi:glutathione reductase (NADPH)
MSQHDFDLFVIGGGSGGVRAARIAGGHGARVAIAEEYRFGGTCVIRGCIPKKLLVYASRFSDDFEDAAGFGWTVDGARFDWPTLIANKDKEIARLEGLYRRTVGNAGATVFDTRATIVDAHTVALAGDGRKITARVILVATGGHPVKPDIPGAEYAITSNEAFHLKALPASILIVGGGYIAVEFAGIFHGLGTRTTLAYRGEKLLRGFDDDLRTGLMEEMARRGIDVRVKADPASIARNGGGYAVTMRDGSTVQAACVMFATGRTPNTRGLGLEKAGVKLGARGEIVVDAESRSSVPSIYAVGDVTDRVNLTPVAIREGHAFADTVFGARRWTVEHDLVPTAVFSTPEIGTVGLPEHIACQRYPDLDCYRARFRPLKHTLSGRDERVTLKLLVDGNTDRVVGCHILGPDAAEIVQMAAIALKMGATKTDFDATMALHPSIAEELVTMRDKVPAPHPPPPKAPLPEKKGYDETA